MITNWEGGVTYRPAVVVRPRTIDDVVRVVSDAVSYPSPVRAVGKLHSPAPCSADVGGTMLDMTGMTRILEIGHDFVTAEAGALYIDVAEELARHDRQFHINTEIGNVTLGAVACAATKDSSLIGTSHWGQVSSFVSGLKIVKPDGTVASYNESDNPDEMRLLRSSYGLLGVHRRGDAAHQAANRRLRAASHLYGRRFPRRRAGAHRRGQRPDDVLLPLLPKR